ncbi:sensor histidine kinase [Geosporobacter ferrireducens]|uniref:sensor histidine kinase n=1 Tax=Geosporobacter ferrireducens TaxID=1424294 RepID=UPI00139B330C|nr:HAMP domain-containing sensor histidine kinase [Geosporobacter ferrireducens]MTI54618.1 HAMP domain-containing histidine kinase [Geosporobacter ferrireducens]
MIKTIPIFNRDSVAQEKPMMLENFKDELDYELLQANIFREKILSCILILFVSIILLLNIITRGHEQLDYYISVRSFHIHIVLIFIPIVFLLLTRKHRRITNENFKLLTVLHVLMNTSVLILCAFIAINNEIINQRPFTYVTAMFSIASLILLSKSYRLFAFCSSYAIYITGILFIFKNPSVVFQHVLFSLPLFILALIVSEINYSAYIRNYMNSKIIESKNQELDKIYKLTEQMLAERTKELNETIEMENIRTAFFANISHELRTPLNVIYAAQQMLDLVLKDTTHENQKEVIQYTRITKQNCYRLIRLIANLIDITKIDAGYLQVNLENIDIVSVAEDITLSAAKYIEDRNIHLVFDTNVEEKIIACDADKIERIILNLLSNAVKFTPEYGSIHVSIEEKEGCIALSVKDTGIGIPPEMKDSIFDRFVQVDKTISRNREGSGIGLSIVKSLVEMHNGKITVISEANKGSEFIIEIPDVYQQDVEEVKAYNLAAEHQYIEKIHIEFSDIYD